MFFDCVSYWIQNECVLNQRGTSPLDSIWMAGRQWLQFGLPGLQALHGKSAGLGNQTSEFAVVHPDFAGKLQVMSYRLADW